MVRSFLFIASFLLMNSIGHSAATEDDSVLTRVSQFRAHAATTRETRVISKETEAEVLWDTLFRVDTVHLTFCFERYAAQNQSDGDGVATNGPKLLKQAINAFADRGEGHQPDLYGKLTNTQALLLVDEPFTVSALATALTTDFRNLAPVPDDVSGKDAAHLAKVLATKYTVFTYLFDQCAQEEGDLSSADPAETVAASTWVAWPSWLSS